MVHPGLIHAADVTPLVAHWLVVFHVFYLGDPTVATNGVQPALERRHTEVTPREPHARHLAPLVLDGVVALNALQGRAVVGTARRVQPALHHRYGQCPWNGSKM